MNGGIIRDALTTTVPLELEYREPSIFREIGSRSERATGGEAEFQHPGRLFEDELTYLFNVIGRREVHFHDERRNSTGRIGTRKKHWNEDGLAGISDRRQMICFALAP